MDIQEAMKTQLMILFTVLIGCAYAQSVGGVLLGNATVCASNNVGTLSVSSYSGSIQRWEFANNPNGPWGVMAHSFSVYAYNNLSQSTWFRVVVQNGSLAPAYSNTVLVTVITPSVFSVAASSTAVCIGSAVTFSIQTPSNNVLAWITSTNNWISASTVTNSGAVYTLMPTVSTQIKATIAQAPCPTATTTAVTLSVVQNPSVGQVSGSGTICSNQSATLSLNGYTGNILQWEQSSAQNNPFYPLANTAGQSSLTLMLNSGSCFRVKVGNGVCNSVNSNAHCVGVESPASGGLITGTNAVCMNGMPITIFLSNFSGTLLHWEKKFLSASTWTPINSSQSFLSITGTTPSSVYRAVLGGSVCPTVYSNSHTMTVHALPILSAFMPNVCEGAIAQPTNNSSGATVYQWRLDNGINYSGSSPQILLTNHGTRTITLISTSSSGCIDSTAINFTVFPKPNVAFSGIDTACVNTSVVHVNTTTLSGSNLLSALIRFGDGVSTLNWPANHTYSVAGIFMRQCIIQTLQGCKDSLSRPIVIRGIQIPQISVSGHCTDSPIQFSQSSTSYNTITWQFGDGNYSNLVAPVHQYSISSNYTIGVQLADAYCTSNNFTVLQVHAMPQATVFSVMGCESDSVNIKAKISPAQANISWLTGDGGLASDTVFKHLYVKAGYYPINYTCATVPSCSISNITMGTIHPLPEIKWQARDICAHDSIFLLVSGNISQVAWQWNKSTTLNANGVWFKPLLKGKNKVHIEVENEKGCKQQHNDSIIVKPLPLVAFSYSSVCAGDTFKIINQCSSDTGITLNYDWQFADGWYSRIKNPVRILTGGGWSFTLNVLADNGCSNAQSAEYNIFELPRASFSIASLCLGDSIQAVNMSNGKYFIEQYTWTINGEKYAQEFAPYFYKSSASLYTVGLKVKDINGCRDSVQNIWQVKSPQSIMFPRDTVIPKGSLFQYEIKSATQSFWFPAINFDNPTAFLQQWRPDSNGCYSIEAKDLQGCIHSHSFCINVTEDYLVKPYALVTADGNQLNDFWYIENIENYPDNKVVILDQWGREVYKAESYHNNWDGRNYKGELLPEGTYYYYLSFRGSAKVYRGYLVLIR